MRLVDTHTLLLEEFLEEEAPNYAILSHTWGKRGDEVSFQEWSQSTLNPEVMTSIAAKPGFRKIERFCQLAREYYKVDYAWVDTCCIDKTSSAELSEAINSMYRWYENAYVCVAYLSDVESPHVVDDDFAQSIWFTRGWTLQELIAPRSLDFWDAKWKIFGDRYDHARDIAVSTGIPISVLRQEKDVSAYSIAERMRWVSRRKTTRGEDMTYCLLGIFNINMPMLYGEGRVKAFLRLQEQIIKQSTDMSIFAWTFDWEDSLGIPVYFSGLLATSPVLFADNIHFRQHDQRTASLREFSITNLGIRFQASLEWDRASGCAILPLNQSFGDRVDIGILLRRAASDVYVRSHPNRIISLNHKARGGERPIHVAKGLNIYQANAMNFSVLKFQDIDLDPNMFSITEVSPKGAWDPTELVLYAGQMGTFEGVLSFSMVLGNPWNNAGEQLHFSMAVRYAGGSWSTVVLPRDGKDPYDFSKLNLYPENTLQMVFAKDVAGASFKEYLCFHVESPGDARLAVRSKTMPQNENWPIDWSSLEANRHATRFYCKAVRKADTTLPVLWKPSAVLPNHVQDGVYRMII